MLHSRKIERQKVPQRMKSQDDFRKILATPRTAPGTAAPSLLPPNRHPRGSSSSVGNPFKKPTPRIRREGRSDVLEHSHVDLGAGFIDRAKERRLAELRGEQESSGEVKGLDFELLKKVRSREFVMPKFEVPEARPSGGSDSEEDEMDEDAILDELLEMEMEERTRQEEVEKVEPEEKLVEEPVMAKEEVDEKTVDQPLKSQFKSIVDAKHLKQMRREQKRRKLAMQAMDQVAKPMAPPPAPKKTRAELLEQLRQIQAAKKQQGSMPPPPPPKPTTEATPRIAESLLDVPAIPSASQSTVTTLGPGSTAEIPLSSDTKAEEPTCEPPRSPSPRLPKVKVSANMFSDESELSDYNPYSSDSGSDSDSEPPPVKDKKPTQLPTKRNYFGDTKTRPEEEASAVPLTMDPTIAAALRKVAALVDKRGIPAEVVKEETKGLNRMSLSGADGVYEFDADDTWDGEEEDEEVGSKKKRKRK